MKNRPIPNKHNDIIVFSAMMRVPRLRCSGQLQLILYGNDGVQGQLIRRLAATMYPSGRPSVVGRVGFVPYPKNVRNVRNVLRPKLHPDSTVIQRGYL